MSILHESKYQNGVYKNPRVKAYFIDQEIQCLANQNIIYKDEFFWRGNLSEIDLMHCVKDVARAWFSVVYLEPSNRAHTLQQPIWLNSNIKNIDGIFYNQCAIDYGITCIVHIVHEDGSFLSCQQISEKWTHNHVHTVFCYN